MTSTAHPSFPRRRESRNATVGYIIWKTALGDNVFYHAAARDREAFVAAIVLEGQRFVINAEQGQNCRVNIVRVGLIFDRV